MKPRVKRVLPLLLLLPLMAQAATPSAKTRQEVHQEVSGYQGEEGWRLRLTFKALEPHPVLGLWTATEAREVARLLESAIQHEEPRAQPRWRRSARMEVMQAGGLLESVRGTQPSALERHIREQYEALLGTAGAGPVETLEGAKWIQALQRSPRYMEEGARAAAMELLSSRAVLLSVGMSMMLYMMAWAAPEPLFTKAFAAAVTVGLLLTYTVAELHQVGRACLALYEEAERARTQEELDAAAERFGKAIGGVGLRVLVTVAGAKLARGLPEVPRGGVWSRLALPQVSLSGGPRGSFTLGHGTQAQVSVANGTVVLMGVSASTAAGAVSAAVKAARTTGDCAESKQEGHHRHHLCTNKNNTSEVAGGPWTPRFEEFFERAGLGLDDPANLVYLRGHQGPHPEAYHREIFRRLDEAVGTCKTAVECRAKLTRALDKIAEEVCQSGSILNQLTTKKP